MNIKDYQKMSVRTMNKELSFRDQTLNMACGVAGEGGEIVDVIKKAMFQGHHLDVEHLKEEIGDILYYITNLATLYGLDMEECLQINYDKLLKRFPNGFSVEDSILRKDRE